MSNLQVVSTVSLNPQNVSHWWDQILKETRNVVCVRRKQLADVLANLRYLPHLETLKIINCSEGPRFPVLFPTTGGCWGNSPIFIIRILKLQRCLLSSQLIVFAGSFPRLEVLELENLRIKKWKQRRHGMPGPNHLVIKRCNWVDDASIETLEFNCFGRFRGVVEQLSNRGRGWICRSILLQVTTFIKRCTFRLLSIASPDPAIAAIRFMGGIAACPTGLAEKRLLVLDWFCFITIE